MCDDTQLGIVIYEFANKLVHTPVTCLIYNL